jgi:hypothetical protein
MNILHKYVFGSVIYGSSSHIYNKYNSRMFEIDDNYNKTERPVLITELLTSTFIKASLCPYIFPFIIYDDLKKTEIYLKGLSKKDYGYSNKKVYRSILNLTFDFS